MPSDSNALIDLVALWPIAAAAFLAVTSVRVLTLPMRVARREAAASAALTLLAAAGLWVWLSSDADAYNNGSSHLDHMSRANLSLAALGLLASLVLAIAAIRRPRRWLISAALAVGALACLAQTYGFLGYTTPG
jgi:cytosine/uracil/thiamine/allantoin permease